MKRIIWRSFTVYEVNVSSHTHTQCYILLPSASDLKPGREAQHLVSRGMLGPLCLLVVCCGGLVFL